MPSLKSVKLTRPLRGANLAAPSWDAAVEARIQERERAAMERGRAEAQKLFGEQMVQQRAQMIALQDGILGALKDSIAGVVRDCEGQLALLAMEVARKLVEEVPITPQMVEASIAAAMRQVEESAHYTVLVNAEDLELLQSATSSILRADDAKKIVVSASKEVSRGGCIVETPFGRVDARRETRFELLKTAILN